MNSLSLLLLACDNSWSMNEADCSIHAQHNGETEH